MMKNKSNFYLSLNISKSLGRDSFGNYLFEVEASNENSDLQNQIVLQNALICSKDHFLRGGVISYDHLHKRKGSKGEMISDPSMIIGEPIDVYFDKKSKTTRVKGKLYKKNKIAQEIIKLLESGSTRIKASVGGIFPQIERDEKIGIEKIKSVLWNDLALTPSPVNSSVGSAIFAKSMSSKEFLNFMPISLRKSLSAGYNTDSSTITGGQALIKKDVGSEVLNLSEEPIKKLKKLLKSGKLNSENESIQFLIKNGIERGKAEAIVSEIITKGGFFMKKSFSKAVSSMLKSLKREINEEEKEQEEEDFTIEEQDYDLDSRLEGDGEDYDDEEEEDKNKEEENDDLVEGEEVLKALDHELSGVRKSISNLNQRIEDLVNAVVGITQMITTFGNEKIPPNSVFAKSLVAQTPRGSQAKTATTRPTEEDLYKAQVVLSRCVSEGKIDMVKSSMISSDLQKCMYTGKPMNSECYQFLQNEFSNEGK